MEYNPWKIEKKWARTWEKKKAWKVDLKKAKKPYYNLMMFPYPSAEGLHVGNVYAFTGADIHGRFSRMRGNDVFEPMGFDSFGIHSENFAIKQNTHPKVQTAKNIKHFTEQLQQLGALFDWDRAVTTSEPEYYTWTQWLFLQLYKAGLAYRAKAPVDWCPSCKTVLADEQVINGKCERCESQVMQKELEQWFFRITKYADRLLKNLEKIDWSERTKIAQRNWIGKSEDTEIIFSVKNSSIKIPVVTTRPDTIFGVTFLVLAPEHKTILQLQNSIENYEEVKAYVAQAKSKNEFERGLGNKKKTGVQLKGVAAINPVNKKEVPLFAADYVLATYGTGAIMGVPGHDDRDFEFAKKFSLPVISVIEEPKTPGVLRMYLYDNDVFGTAEVLRSMGKPMEYWTPTQRRYDVPLQKIENVITVLEQARVGTVEQYKRIREGSAFSLEINPVSIDFGTVYSGDGVHINSEFLNGLDTKQAIEKIVQWLNERKLGGKSVHYHLRDWLISRQRYWGPPIPIVYCKNCGTIPVPEKDLPVKLPFVKNFRPTGTGKSPLASVPSFVKTKCPQCKGPAERETDVSDTFLDSAWYFFRYPSVRTQNTKISPYGGSPAGRQNPNSRINPKSKIQTLGIPWNIEITKKWLPVDMYIGGQEHAVLHLLYTRFITMALKDLGFIDVEEPFKKFRAHGLLTKDGAKMSKSKGNVVNPDEYFKKYGADTVRMYLMFLGPFAEGGDWSDKGIVGIYRFLNRVWQFVQKSETNSKFQSLRHKTIKKVTEDLENLRYNTAIAALMEYLNAMQNVKGQMSKDDIETLLVLLAPFAPHITEELWHQLGHKDSVHSQPWSKYDARLIKEKRINLILQVNGKVRDIVEVASDTTEEQAKEAALKSKKIQKWITGQVVKKVIFVQGRLINIVV